MKRATALALLIILLLTTASTVEAAKPRIRKISSTAAKAANTNYSSVKLSRATNSLKVTFSNLNNVNGVTYLLSYVGNGKEEGARGSVNPSSSTTDLRDLYFGTCSHGVCTPHKNIKNAVLLVTAKLKSGGTHTKRYRIKI